MYDTDTDLLHYCQLFVCQKVYLDPHNYEHFHQVKAVLLQAFSSNEDRPIAYAEFFGRYHHSQMLLNLISNDHLQESTGYQQIVAASFHQRLFHLLHAHPRRES